MTKLMKANNMIRTMIKTGIVLGLCLIPMRLLMASEPDAIASGKTVKFHYALTVDNKIVDSNIGGEPLTYVQGRGEMIPGLEKQLEGMKAGEKKALTIPQEEAYGPLDPNALVEVPIEKLPKDADQPGTMLSVVGDQGQNMHAVVKEIRGQTAILDFNHPLAGKELHFDVEIAEVI